MSGLGFLQATIAKDLRRRGTEWFAILSWIAIPLFVGSLIMLISSGDNGPQPKGTLLLTDEDQTFVSGAVAQAFQNGPLADMITVEMVNREDGSTRIEAGEASSWLVIPDGFTDALLREQPTTLSLKTNPSQRILPSIITETVNLIADAGFYIQRLFKPELALLADLIDEAEAEGEGPPAPEVGLLAQTLTTKINTLAETLFETSLTVTQVREEVIEEAQGPSLADLFLPGLLLMGLMFAAGGLAEDWWQERLQSTLRRHVSAPRSVFFLILGKALAALTILSVVAFVTLSAGFAYLGLPLSLFPSAFAWLLAGGLALYLMLSFVLMLAPNRQGASILSNLVTIPLLMMGGSFFPLAAMPAAIAAIGQWTPNGYMTKALGSYLQGGGADGLWLGAGPVVLGFIVLCLVLVTFSAMRFTRA